MSIYQSLYDLVNTYVFGGLVTNGAYEELVCILVATTGAVFIIALPFILVLKIIIRWI